MAGETLITGEQLAIKGETTVFSEAQIVNLISEGTQGLPGARARPHAA